MPILCPRCKKKIVADARFCTECGVDIASYSHNGQKSRSQPELPAPGYRGEHVRTENKKLNNTAILQILAAGILILGGFLVFSSIGTFAPGMSSNAQHPNVSVTPVPNPVGIDSNPSLVVTPVPTPPSTPVTKPTGFTPKPTSTVRPVPTSLYEYCTKNYPGTSYNPATRHCEALSTAPQLRPTPVIDQASPAVTPLENSEAIYRDYSWSYKGTDWSWNGGFPKSGYAYYQGKSHTRENNYAEYALSDYDRKMILGIVQKFRDGGIQKGYTENDNVLNIVSFVQSLSYTSDLVTTGYDEYPRYPIETLVDNGGDCEDTAILTAALLHELGYGVVLIRLPGHMAVGIKGTDNLLGTSYEFQGSKYYYLETTGQGWGIGELPRAYKNLDATIFPLVQIPLMDMKCHSTVENADSFFVYYRQRCEIENIGVGTAKNPKMYFAAVALDKGADMIWEPDQTVTLDDFLEDGTGYAEATLRVPPDERTQIKYLLYGDNFAPVELRTPVFSS